MFPAGRIAPESPVELLEQRQKTEETSVPVEAEKVDFDRANMRNSGRRKKKGVPAVTG